MKYYRYKGYCGNATFDGILEASSETDPRTAYDSLVVSMKKTFTDKQFTIEIFERIT